VGGLIWMTEEEIGQGDLRATKGALEENRTAFEDRMEELRQGF